MNPKIEIVIAPDGTSRVETYHIQGSGCQIASRFIEQALGQRLEEKLKPEFFEQFQHLQQPAKGISK